MLQIHDNWLPDTARYGGGWPAPNRNIIRGGYARFDRNSRNRTEMTQPEPVYDVQNFELFAFQTEEVGSVRRSQGRDDSIGIHGLVNINTAPWPVLAMLPLLPEGVPQRDARIVALAQAIEAYRDTNGPFRSIMELNHVPGFQNGMGALGDIASLNAGPAHGFHSDHPNPVSGDFVERMLMVTRVSNLVTLRSDSFTVYVTVEGWMDAGTPQARRIFQRHSAYFMERDALFHNGPNVHTTRIPMD